jgi:16S rRNA (adenine1518-N6/adenine1519-N6)-dimethyltransferase
LPSSLRDDIAARLASLNLTPDTDRLDQHLLVDDRVLRRLLATADVTPDSTVLDVGAGPGTIADAIAPSVAHVVALELDWRFAPLLRAVAERRGNVTVTFGDVRLRLPEVDAIVASPPWGLLELLASALVRRPVASVTIIASTVFADASTATSDSPAFDRTSVFVQSRYAAESVERVPPSAFLPEPRRPGVLMKLRRQDNSRSRRAFARALATPGRRRVRDFAASIVRQRRDLGVNPQLRLQQLTTTAIAEIWDALA